MKSLYLIPLYERTIEITRFGQLKLLHIDSVGAFIRTDGTHPLTTDFLRRFLVFRSSTKTLIAAETPAEAIQEFLNEWEGANVGGTEDEQKALWIDKDQPILELPPCEHMRKDERGVPRCGDDGAGCIYDYYDMPDFCPHSSIHEWIAKNQETIKLQSVSVVGKDFQLASYKSIVHGRKDEGSNIAMCGTEAQNFDELKNITCNQCITTIKEKFEISDE